MSQVTQAQSVVNQRERLKRMIAAVSRPATGIEKTDLDNLLRRGDPERLQGTSASRYIGSNALTLTRETMHLLKPTGFVFSKVNGIGVLGAMFGSHSQYIVIADGPSDRLIKSASNCTMLFVRRNGSVFAVDNVPVPRRNGRILLDGELCVRRKQLSASEISKIRKPIDCVVGFSYMQPEDALAESDSQYEICYAVHDVLVADDSHASNSRSKTGDSVCVQAPEDRLAKAISLLQCPPIGDSKGEDAVSECAAEFGDNNALPSIRVFFKPPFLTRDVRLALKTIPSCLHGIHLDGLIFAPGVGQYLVNQTNPELLKYKAWRDNTGDFVIRKTPEDSYRFFVLTHENKARCISENLWLGDTEDEQEVSRRALQVELDRLANGGSATTPVIFECEPSVANMAEFMALRSQYTNKDDLLLAAGKLLRWRPVGVLRDEKTYPNSEINFWTIVDALINCVTAEDIVKHLRSN